MSSQKLKRPKSSIPKKKPLPSSMIIPNEKECNSQGVLKQESQQDFSETESTKRIQELVRKTAQMNKEADKNDEFVEDNLDGLRTRINNTVGFLKSTKNQIENVKFMMQREMLNGQSVGDSISSDQTIETIQTEMRDIRMKLKLAGERLKKQQEAHTDHDENFESTLKEAADALENISKGDYDGPTKE